MKALELHQHLEEQLRSHGKRIFTVAELANFAGSSVAATRVELHRLRHMGVIEQYAHARYGLPGGATAEELLASLDSGAYISGMYALHAPGMVTQVPHRVTCITNKRHNRSRVRNTRVGTLEFVCVSPRIYAPPAKGRMASPEQALCDYVYLCRRAGIDAQSQVTFRRVSSLNAARLKRTCARYPAAVQAEVARIID
ncbi:hypothetical protein GX586_16450 [bacterium]|nr:hypothetical protein [bacterium]